MLAWRIYLSSNQYHIWQLNVVKTNTNQHVKKDQHHLLFYINWCNYSSIILIIFKYLSLYSNRKKHIPQPLWFRGTSWESQRVQIMIQLTNQSLTQSIHGHTYRNKYIIFVNVGFLRSGQRRATKTQKFSWSVPSCQGHLLQPKSKVPGGLICIPSCV